MYDRLEVISKNLAQKVKKQAIQIKQFSEACLSASGFSSLPLKFSLEISKVPHVALCRMFSYACHWLAERKYVTRGTSWVLVVT